LCHSVIRFDSHDPNFFESDAHAVPVPHQFGSRAAKVALTSFAIARRRLSHVPQRGLVLAVFAGVHDRLDAHVRTQREQTEQQTAPQGVPIKVLPGGDRGELGGEVCQEVGVLEHFALF
jgi:hypothetical protein